MTADPILTLGWLVLAHLVADFVIQTTGIVVAKTSRDGGAWRGLLAHGLGVAVCLVPVALAFGVPGLWALVAITVAHVVIDRIKVVATHAAEARAVDEARRRHEGRAAVAGLGRAWTPLPAVYFALDQLAHLAVIAVAWAIWLAGQAPTVEWSAAIGRVLGARDQAVINEVSLVAVVFLSLLIANTRAGALFVATLVRPIEAATGSDEAPEGAAAAAAGQSEPASEAQAERPRGWSFRIGPFAGRVLADPAPRSTAAAARPARPRPGSDRRAAGQGRRDDRRPRAAPHRDPAARRGRRRDRIRRGRQDHRPVPAPRRPRLRRVLPARDARQRVRRDRHGTRRAGSASGLTAGPLAPASASRARRSVAARSVSSRFGKANRTFVRPSSGCE